MVGDDRAHHLHGNPRTRGRLWLAIATAAAVGIVLGFAISRARGAGFHPAMFAAARGGAGAGLLVALVAATVISVRRRQSDRPG